MRAAIIAIIGLAALLCAALLAGRAPEKPWNLTNVAGDLPDLHFSLISDTGAQVSQQSYHGKVVLLYFGFTRCPALCPLAMSHMQSVFKALGKDADSVQLLFVTVDPAQDTPAVLRQYLHAFDARHMTGLTGEESLIQDLAHRYHAPYQPSKNVEAIMHGDAFYIFDREGRARLLATSDSKNTAIIEDLQRLVDAGH